MDIPDVLAYLLIGAFLGAVGQAARTVVGIKKARDQAAFSKAKDWFDMSRFWISIILGAVAGTLAAVVLWDAPITKQVLLSLVAAGYAGADFIVTAHRL